MAVWPTDEMGGPAKSVLWAARAAMVIQQKASHLAPVGGYPIRLRAGIGVGPAWLLDIGSDHGQRIFVPVGRAIQEMASAQRAVGASETGVSEAVRSLLGAAARTEAASSWSAAGRLTAVDRPPGPPRAPAQPRPRVSSVPASRYVPDLVLRTDPFGTG